mmetsp:Transcript_5235/g.13433  ORF Transcript_5235/g.13433 Transcript_5235/m.13433 type:complete len:248 (-) Transcript_5235:270-1013(-)
MARIVEHDICADVREIISVHLVDHERLSSPEGSAERIAEPLKPLRAKVLLDVDDGTSVEQLGVVQVLGNVGEVDLGIFQLILSGRERLVGNMHEGPVVQVDSHVRPQDNVHPNVVLEPPLPELRLFNVLLDNEWQLSPRLGLCRSRFGHDRAPVVAVEDENAVAAVGACVLEHPELVASGRICCCGLAVACHAPLFNPGRSAHRNAAQGGTLAMKQEGQLELVLQHLGASHGVATTNPRAVHGGAID